MISKAKKIALIGFCLGAPVAPALMGSPVAACAALAAGFAGFAIVEALGRGLRAGRGLPVIPAAALPTIPEAAEPACAETRGLRLVWNNGGRVE